MARLEYKYLLPASATDLVRRRLATFVEPDHHRPPGRDQYTIRSIYFDTRDLDYYYEKESGIQHRRKLRLRGYNEYTPASRAYLEIKRKDDMAISKARACCLFDEAEVLFSSGDLDRYLEGGLEGRADGRAFFYHLHRHALRPVILVTYEREAFFARHLPALRLTLDQNLRSAPFPAIGDLYREDRMTPSLQGYAIFEVKFSLGRPAWLMALLAELKLERLALSKYTIALDEHRLPQQRGAFSVLACARPLSLQPSKEGSMSARQFSAVAG
jgi:hypothetical protein